MEPNQPDPNREDQAQAEHPQESPWRSNPPDLNDNKSPEISLIHMRNSNEITNSTQFGNMKISSEIRKRPDDMFLSKDESFFTEISNKNPLVFDTVFEKKKKTGRKPDMVEVRGDLPDQVGPIDEEREHDATDDEAPDDQWRRAPFADFDDVDKDKPRLGPMDEQSTQLAHLETEETQPVDVFEHISLSPEDPRTQEDPEHHARGVEPRSVGNFTKRKSAFHPSNLRLGDTPRQEIELAPSNNQSNFSIEKNKSRPGPGPTGKANVASITSLGNTSQLRKDFTKDKLLLGKGYSKNLLNAMNEYSLVLDHIRSHKKNQLDPYKDVKSFFELKNVHKTYLVGMEGVPAIRGIDLKIYEGEFLMIYGKSGGGKSSLLNLIGTIDEPNKGSIHMKSHGFLDCLKDPQLSEIRLNNIGFVFQSFNLINSLTALENIKLPMLLKGKVSSKEAHERALALMEELSILHRKDSYPRQMSGGEQQRVTIARAVANRPKMLLLDEPTGDLDSKNSLIVMKILLELNIKDKITMIMVTHDEHVKDLADRIVYVIDGKINKCVVNQKEQQRKVIDKLFRDAEQVRREINELKLRDAQTDDVKVKPKKVFRNPIHHPFFKHLSRKARNI